MLLLFESSLQYHKSKYLIDPHGATAFLGLKKYMFNNPETIGLFLETAHPVKFMDTVENALNIKINIPQHILELKKKERSKIQIREYKQLKSFLLSR